MISSAETSGPVSVVVGLDKLGVVCLELRVVGVVGVVGVVVIPSAIEKLLADVSKNPPVDETRHGNPTAIG